MGGQVPRRARTTPNDVDVLIVGSPHRDDVHDRLTDAARLLHREVNPTFVSVDRWSDPAADPFLATVAGRPTVSIATPDYTPRGVSRMSWAIGRETNLAMLDAGDLEQVAPNAEFAQTLNDKARKHLATADLLQNTNLEIAFDALYTAARLSMTALVATQGLRPPPGAATSHRSQLCEPS